MDFPRFPSIEHVKMLESPASAAGGHSPGGLNFGAEIAHAMSEVKAAEGAAKAELQAFLKGEQTDLHQVAIAAQKAELQFETMLEFRNKFLQAYQEIMRM
jgi:flagellar hook-basal body complex protein FliE